MTPNDAAPGCSNEAVRNKVVKASGFARRRRPLIGAGDLVKIMLPHSTVRRINIANCGPRPYRVEAVVTASSGLTRYRVAGMYFCATSC